MPRKLKVFRTSTGFHDAYVAAPSRKAALAAWGSDADLFARGVAEEVTAAKLMTEPLKRPGEVIRLSRGDLGAQLKALGPRKKPAGKARTEASPAKPNERKQVPPTRPPKRDKVDAADAALREAQHRHVIEVDELERKRDAIDRKLQSLQARQSKEIARLERKRDDARAAYREALEEWSS